MKKIVVVGGGSGIISVLKGLKEYPHAISAVVTTFDSGGSTGRLRSEFGVLPARDIRRTLVALAGDEGDHTLRDLFTYRFPVESSLQGHSFGNLLIQALSAVSGSEKVGIEKAAELLHIKGNVFPVSFDKSNLCARLENRALIKGETNIDIPVHDGSLHIEEVFLEPPAKIYEKAAQALREADLIVLGPGDLYTSIIPNILTSGFPEAVRESKAKVIYICNIMTKWGETYGFSASDFAKTLLKYLKCEMFDHIICNTAEMPLEILKMYEKEKAWPVKIDKENLILLARNILTEDLVVKDANVAHHDAKAVSRIINSLL